MKIFIINGPNINFLGIREKEIYGNCSYENMINYISDENKDIDIVWSQFNSEGDIINKLQEAYYENADAIIINPGAYTHYSYAIFDAIKSINIPTIEVHISNINKREDFRSKSVIAPACIGQINGFGIESYNMAIKYLKKEKI